MGDFLHLQIPVFETKILPNFSTASLVSASKCYLTPHRWIGSVIEIRRAANRVGKMSFGKVISALVLLADSGCSSGDFSQISGRTFALERPQVVKLDEVSVAGGAPADPAKFTATFKFVGDKYCTATVVGRRSVITAAHCLKSSTHGTINLNGASIPLVCTIPLTYSGVNCDSNPIDYRCVADIAICLAANDLSSSSLSYEQLGVLGSKTRPKVGDSAYLLGYGCVQQNGPMSNDLVIGGTKIFWTPGGHGGPMNNYLGLEGGAVGCRGDSGSGVLNSVDNDARRIIGIASWIKASDKQTFIVPIDLYEGFLQNWGNSNNTKVCGIHALKPYC